MKTTIGKAMMTKTLVGMLALGAGVFCANQAAATPLSVGDAYYLGYLAPDTPADPADEATFINFLVTMTPGTGPTLVPGSPHSTYDTRSGNTFSPLDQISPVSNASALLSGGSDTVNLNGNEYEYLAAKYSTYAEVWYIGGLTGTITIPENAGGHGLSGWNVYVPYTAPVPDGGITVLMFGAALTGLGVIKRRLLT